MKSMRPHAVQLNTFDLEERKGYIYFDSSNLCCARYDEEMEELRVHFVSGGVYTLYDVPLGVVKRLLLAPSAGAFFVHYMRPRFCYVREE